MDENKATITYPVDRDEAKMMTMMMMRARVKVIMRTKMKNDILYSILSLETLHFLGFVKPLVTSVINDLSNCCLFVFFKEGSVSLYDSYNRSEERRVGKECQP